MQLQHPTRPLQLATAAVLGICTALTGCGPEKPETHDVSGIVTYNNQPVEGAQVMFTPGAGPPATGVTGPDGKYQLSTFSSRDGAVAGAHRVVVTKNVVQSASANDPYPQTRNELPAQYASASQSGLTAEVMERGANEFNFDLKD